MKPFGEPSFWTGNENIKNQKDPEMFLSFFIFFSFSLNMYSVGRNSSLVVFGLAVHSVAGSILLWGNFLVEGIFPLELTWVQTPFPPKKLFRMRA